MIGSDSAPRYYYVQKVIQSLVFNMNNDTIDLNPSYQRDIAWSESKRKELIVSVWIGLPIPMIFIAPQLKAKNKMECVDGKNRLTSIKEYVTDKFVIYIGDENIDGKKFSELQSKYQDIFMNVQLQICEYTQISEEQKRDFFSRIQKGVGLSAVEQMHAMDNHNLVMYVRSFSDKNKTSISKLWKTDRFSDYTYILNIIAMIMKKHKFGYSSKSSSLLNVCAGHSTSLISWMKHQPEDENYDFITNDLDMVLERLTELESTSNLNLKDKYKVHFLYDVSRYYIMHYISGRSFHNKILNSICRFVSLLNTRYDSKIKSSNIFIETYYNISSSGAKSGQYANKLISQRFEVLRAYIDESTN